jgi:hypothetical protein
MTILVPDVLLQTLPGADLSRPRQISGSHSGVVLLVCDAVSLVSVPQCFEGTECLHLQRLRGPRRMPGSFGISLGPLNCVRWRQYVISIRRNTNAKTQRHTPRPQFGKVYSFAQWNAIIVVRPHAVLHTWSLCRLRPLLNIRDGELCASLLIISDIYFELLELILYMLNLTTNWTPSIACSLNSGYKYDILKPSI